MSKKQKMKIRKSISRRFKVTPTGKVLFRGANIRHLRRHKSKSMIRDQKTPQQMTGRWAKKIKKLLGK